MGKCKEFIDFVNKGDQEQVTNFLKEDSSLSNASLTESHSTTALMHAVYEGHIEIIQTLIAHGADVNASNAVGQTAMYYAIKRPIDKEDIESSAHNKHVNATIVKILMDHGVHTGGNNGYSNKPLLKSAIEANNCEIVDMLINDKAAYQSYYDYAYPDGEAHSMLLVGSTE